MAYHRQRTEAPNGSPQGCRWTERMQVFGVLPFAYPWYHTRIEAVKMDNANRSIHPAPGVC